MMPTLCAVAWPVSAGGFEFAALIPGSGVSVLVGLGVNATNVVGSDVWVAVVDVVAVGIAVGMLVLPGAIVFVLVEVEASVGVAVTSVVSVGGLDRTVAVGFDVPLVGVARVLTVVGRLFSIVGVGATARLVAVGSVRVDVGRATVWLGRGSGDGACRVFVGGGCGDMAGHSCSIERIAGGLPLDHAHPSTSPSRTL